ncbi:MAG: extracellular solute-binding protein [Lachnospiraceae bacterium]|nr:extracellular solute-binding protein [Lachnospiraceae bacterium]
MRKKLSFVLGALLVCALVIGLVKTSPVDAASKVKLNAKKKTIYIGEKFQLELEGATGDVKWSTSKKKIATVENGVVTAVKKGKTTITAKDLTTNKAYKCKITVKKNAISNKTLSLKGGESYGLTLKGNTIAEWKSSDESVATVNNGTVTALKKGKATITAKVGSKKYTCKVTVTEDAAVSDEPIELTIWCLSGEDNSVPDSYMQAIEELKASYPNVTVNAKAFENEEYKVKLKAAGTANDLPDIFYTWSGSFLGDLVNADAVYCLDDVMNKYVKSGDVPKVMLDNTTYNQKRYGIPLNMNVVVLYANMDLLKEAGYTSVPKTIDDLIVCCDKLVEKGITPFGCAGEPWCISEYFEPIMEKTIGAAALNDVFSGKASFNNEGIAESADMLKSMIEKGYIKASDLELSNGEISGGFMAGDYAFYMNGSWNCGMFAGDPEFSSKVTVAEFPVINSKNSKAGELIGGPSGTLAVSGLSKNTSVAAEYAVALGKLVCKYDYLSGGGLPSWKINYDDSEVDELTKQVAKLCANAKGYVLFGDTALPGEESDPYLKCLEELARGNMDGKGFISELSKSIR